MSRDLNKIPTIDELRIALEKCGHLIRPYDMVLLNNYLENYLKGLNSVITIKGVLDSIDDLPLPPIEEGDSYVIDGHLYIWREEEWADIGTFRGPKGDKGDTGDKGDKGDGLDYSTMTPEEIASIKGDPGEKGDKGDPGPRGEKGAPLTVRKTYQTEAEALEDKNPIDPTTSLPLEVGQFVSIVADEERNGIYRIHFISEDGTMSLELQGTLGDLSGYVKKDEIRVLEAVENKIVSKFTKKGSEVLPLEILNSEYTDTDIWVKGSLVSGGLIVPAAGKYVNKEKIKLPKGEYHLVTYLSGNSRILIFKEGEIIQEIDSSLSLPLSTYLISISEDGCELQFTAYSSQHTPTQLSLKPLNDIVELSIALDNKEIHDEIEIINNAIGYVKKDTNLINNRSDMLRGITEGYLGIEDGVFISSTDYHITPFIQIPNGAKVSVEVQGNVDSDSNSLSVGVYVFKGDDYVGGFHSRTPQPYLEDIWGGLLRFTLPENLFVQDGDLSIRVSAEKGGIVYDTFKVYAYDDSIFLSSDVSVEKLATFLDGLTSEGLAKFNAGLESAFVLVENEATQGVVQGLTEVDNTPVPLMRIAQVFTESMESTSGAERLGDLSNVDDSFDTVPDAVYSLRKQAGIFYPILGGGSTSARLTLTYITPATATISLETPFEIEYMFTSIIDEESTGVGAVTYRVNNRIVGGETIQQGTNVFDVKRHLVLGDNNAVVSVTDSYGNTRTLSFRITAVKVELTSTFNANQIFGGNIAFRFVPIGFGTMTITISVDGSYHGKVVSAQSNRQLTYNIPKLSHGEHIIEAVMSIDSDGEIVTSNKLEFSIISIEEGNNTAIIASAFTTAEATQFDTVVIPFTVYNPLSVNTDIDMIVNEEVIQSRVVDRTQQYWSVNLTESGSITLQIKAGSVSKFFYVEVAESNIADLEETKELELKLISEGRNNAESNRDSWEYIDIKSSFNNFNWTSNGWAMDSNGSSYLKVSGDAKLEIPFKVFDTDFKLDGKTIEIQFFTEDVSNLDYVVLSCMQGDKGFEITSQKVTFKSEQSTITTQFKENELIKVSISVEQSAKNRLLSLFINGILSGVLQYPTSDNFIQSIPANIIAQGAEATIGIYTIRVYKTDLQPWQILNNYIFDYPDARERESIYIRNNILGADGDISYARLVEELPCLIITGDLPQYKGDKKTSEIEFEDRQNPERSFTATNVQNDVQGTSSQYYPRKNYKMKFRSGFNMSDGSYAEGFQTHEHTLPATVFTHKADFAEASGTHNTGLAKVMENTLKTLNIKTPPQLVDDKIRTTVDGFAIAIFHRQNPEDRPVFIGKYNFNTDKAAENTFGFDTPVECWEIRNNTSRRVLFKESDYTGDDWLNDFEGRFPEDNTNPVNLKRMTDWVVSCIGNPTKFRDEFSQYFHQDFMLSYWVLTELFGMVDQRAKNVFWTTFDTQIWLPIFYDNDTALGINNEGVNAFYFDIEIHDKIGTQDVWNGADSELWKLIEQAFPDELVAMYQRIRANNTLSYDSVLSILNGEHSDRWSETVYNEDGQFKYIDPLLVDGNGSYLYAAQGSREEHRKWWLYNRFRYMDSKYNTGDFKSDYITMRLYTPSGSLAVEPNADFTVTTFGSQYIRAKWGSYETSQRVKLGEEVTFESPDITFNDTETILYGASYLKTIGDLSGKYAGTVDVSKGTQLTEVIIGNSTPGYVNTNLHVLNVGNNKLLRKINIENCPNLTQAIDLSGCIGLEEVYAKGSGITGVSLSQGGEINLLSLPATLINLTIIGQPIRLTGLQLEGYDKLSSLHTDKCPNLNSYTLVKDILSNPNALQNIRLIDIDATDTNSDTLLALTSMRGIDDNGFIVDNAVISGKIHIDTVESYDLDIINATFPFLVVSYDELTHTPVRRISVIRGKDNSAVKEHLVTINDNPYYTDELGMVVVRTPDTLTVRVELEGYRTEERLYNPVVADTDYEIKMANFVTVSILIKSTEGEILKGVSVLLNGETKETNIQGIAQFHELSSGTYTLSVTYGNTYTDTVTVGHNDLIHTYEEVVVPKRTIRFRHQTASSSFSDIADMEVYIDNVIYTTNSNGEVVYEGAESIVVETTDARYKAIKQTLPTFSTVTKLDLINMHSFYTAEISVVGKNGYPLNGTSVTLGSATALVVNSIASFPNTSYATGVNLKASFGGETVTQTVSLGYTSYSKTVTLQVDEIEAMKPVPNGNIQILAKASSTNTRGLFLNVRGWSGQNATIDWGDGSAPEVIVANETLHTYPDLSFYNIEISNATNLTMADLEQVSSSGGYYACVIAYWTIGNSKVKDIFSHRGESSGKPNLVYLGDDMFINDTGRTDFSYLLYGADKLISIPAGLFDNCVNATSFRDCFSSCFSLTSLPEGLFDNCVNVTNFDSCFRNCRSLTSLPEGLFDNCVNVTDFSYCLRGCAFTSIPEGLFDNCVNVTSFDNCFAYSSSLAYCEIPMLKLDANRNQYLAGVSRLTVLVSNSLTPPVIVSNTIPNNTKLKIYVPDDSITDYKTATNWVAYESKIYPLSEYENN